MGVPFKKNLETTISIIELILEGLYTQKKLNRSEKKGYYKVAEKRDGEYYEDFPEQKKSFN